MEECTHMEEGHAFITSQPQAHNVFSWVLLAFA
jgi:hypothetical protein